jgi:hypothetical protein
MAYILGFIYADGSIDRCPKIRASYLNIGSTDKDILVSIRKAMGSVHRIKIKAPSKLSKKTFYLFRIGSNYLCDALERHGVFPHKSLTIQLPRIPLDMLGHFARGYFDGDGCVHLEKRKGEYIRLTTAFTSGSKIFLIELEKALRKQLDIPFKKVYASNRNTFQLRYSTRDSLVLFDFMYKKPYDDLYLKRKKNLFEAFIAHKA